MISTSTVSIQIIVLAIIIFFLSRAAFLIKRQKGEINSYSSFFTALVVPYVIIIAVLLLHLLKRVNLVENDLIALYAMIAFFVAFVLLSMGVQLMDKHSYYFLLIFPLASLFFLNEDFFNILALTSSLLLIFLSLAMMRSVKPFLLKSGIFVLLYALFNGFFFILPSSSFWGWLFLPHLLMTPLSVFFCKSIYASIHPSRKLFFLSNVWNNHFLFFIRYFVFITLLCLFSVLAVVAIHELGHALVSNYEGCDYVRTILYDSVFAPHTEVLCDDSEPLQGIALAGVFAPILFGLLFWLSGGSFIKKLALFIFGMSLLISYGDLITIGVSSGLSLSISLLGFALLSIAVVHMGIHQIELEQQREQGGKHI